MTQEEEAPLDALRIQELEEDARRCLEEEVKRLRAVAEELQDKLQKCNCSESLSERMIIGER